MAFHPWAVRLSLTSQRKYLNQQRISRKSPLRAPSARISWGNLKPSIAFQRVRHPPGKGAARQPEASLAWAPATTLVKRRQRRPKPGVEPRYHVHAGAFGVLDPGAASAGPPWRGPAGPAGV